MLAATNIDTLEFQSLAAYIQQHQKEVALESLQDEGWNLGSEAEHGLLKKLQSAGIPLGKYVNGKIFYGIKTGLNEAFVIDEATKDALIKEDAKSAEIIKPFLAGRDIKRYQPPQSDKYLILFEKGFTNKKGNFLKNAWKWLEENYSAIAEHLNSFEEKAVKRFDKGDYWWELRACDYYEEFEKFKIMIPDIALRMQAAYDVNHFYCVNTAYIIPTNDKVLLAILNSSLIHFLYLKISSSIRGGYLRFIRQYLEILPIIKPEKQLHDEIVKLVDTMLTLNKERQQTTLSEKLESLQHRIQYTDAKINQLVYRLYGLTEAEIALIENV